MEYNIILSGVGGQGILSMAFVICNAAREEGLYLKQAEVHGMAQRGGAVQSNLRLSDHPIASDIIPQGKCHLLLSVEPLEVLRYFPYLNQESSVVTSMTSFVNIPNYPKEEEIWGKMEMVQDLTPIDAGTLARRAGSTLAQGMVMLGAASGKLPISPKGMESWVKNLWRAKGEKVVETNLNAFQAGARMGEFLRAVATEGGTAKQIRGLALSVPLEKADPKRALDWTNFLKNTDPGKWAEEIPAHT